VLRRHASLAEKPWRPRVSSMLPPDQQTQLQRQQWLSRRREPEQHGAQPRLTVPAQQVREAEAAKDQSATQPQSQLSRRVRRGVRRAYHPILGPWQRAEP